MYTLFLSASQNDLMINKRGKLQTINGAQEVRQRTLVTLRHRWQEYFMNVPAGIPWYEFLLGSKDLGLVETIVRQTILNVPGVVSIVSISITYSTTVKHQALLNATIEVYGIAGSDIVAIENEVLGGSVNG